MNALGMIDLTASDSESSLSSAHQSHDEDVVYSRWKGQLLDCLNGITSSGDFSASRLYQTFPNPCLRIAGRAAVIPLPLTDHDAEAIRGACKEAPFGRGDETLVDTSVRKTWELDATHFECTNPSWPAFFRTVLDDVATGLGLPNVRAKPHKLLLYEKGSFFKRHKDSEKEVGMIATLVICLPAAHRGGSVQLSFGPEKREIATAPASPFDITALAWFSDVDHEIKPLNFGHRLVLTYKLFQSGSAKRSAHFLVEQSRQLKSILGKWRPQFPTALMLAYPLEHQYTKSSLSLKNLKGRDHAVCHSLKEISAACDLHLALAHMTRTEDDPDDYYGTGDGEASVTLDTIYSCEGLQIGSSHDVDEAEILGSIFKDREPDSEDEGEFTGNESAPGSFRYHDTVAVLIPKQHIHQLLKTSFYSGLSNEEAENLLSMVKQDFHEHQDRPFLISSTLKVMTKALDVSHGSAQSTLPCTVAKWALETSQQDLYQMALKVALSCKTFSSDLLGVISHFLDETFAKNPKDVDWEKWLGPILRSTSVGGWYSVTKMFTTRLGTKSLQDSFSLWAQSQLDLKLDTKASFTLIDHDFFLANLDQAVTSDRILSALISRGSRELISKVLESIFQRRAQYNNEAFKFIFENTLERACSSLVLQTSDLPVGAFWGYIAQSNDESRVPCQRFMVLIKQSLTVGVTAQAIRLIEESHRVLSEAMPSWDRSSIRKDSLVHDLLAPLASTLQYHHITFTPSVAGFFEFLIREVLHFKVPTHPQKPRGWRHKRRGCSQERGCMDCVALNAFLESEDQKIWSFCAAESRRKHIDAYLPPSLFTKDTLRNRAPYTLVVEKRGKEHAEEVQKFLQQLKDFENVLAPLQSDVFAAMLGEAAYKELILLENIKIGLPPRSVAGVKRPSESYDTAISVRQRR